ncbi:MULTISPECIES: thiamine phosphate synthase [unclassified Haematospirillum]|uniref:thiamine phosphate synthase n=1 Tax=unclassified Haematospirillum TaxID=2622088 RepID=UPI001438E83F|nr:MULTISPECIES: thiamine phosphate synthase [unclassified Haematospirillum]NKD55583.1 thiamine phosphate synthase [Haematospirillum sp. H4890]NKD75722.1 thiamine phosphate synthase [Haematospirillum sp. H4485]NKD88286.1 thiamine phosphate synthase [Haematospirillum sp. 15-248]
MSFRTLAIQAAKLNASARGNWPAACPVPWLVFMTDPRVGDPVAIVRRLPPGSAVILRHYDDRFRSDLALRLRDATQKRDIRLLVAADHALAVACAADGVHLPEGLLRRALCSELVDWRRAGGLVTAAVHSHQALVMAGSFGVDAALVSPVFPTVSHPGAAALGVFRFRALVQRSRVPVLALGGISASTLPRLYGSGAWGVAAVSALA